MSKRKNKSRNISTPNNISPTRSPAPVLQSPNNETHWLQMIPIVFFSACVILIVRMYSYNRDMNQFYWSNNTDGDLVDFFSYYKSIAILICAALVVLFIIIKFCMNTFKPERSFIYIPAGIYVAFVLLSYFMSDYKDFALMGYNDRFEGTLVLVAYMIVFIYVANTIKTERNVKWVIYPIAASSFVLSLIGISQATNHDFFRTSFGQKLIVPNTAVEGYPGVKMHDLIDVAAEQGKPLLDFTFQNQEIYQTVYNINYVSFYLTLLLPIFGMLFIRSMMLGKDEKLYKKISWGLLFALSIYNFIGSASSGGLIGLGVMGLLAIILLNKNLVKWWKPVALLIVLLMLTLGITTDRWLTEYSSAVKGAVVPEHETAGIHKLNYIDTDQNNIIISLDDTSLTIVTDPSNPSSIKVMDGENNRIDLIPDNSKESYTFDNEKLKECLLQTAKDSEGSPYVIFTADNHTMDWRFKIANDGVKYLNIFNKLVDLDKIPIIGWENSQGFGSYRGYIWSRTIPMFESTFLIGTGADTYCIYFPQRDYISKYNQGMYSSTSDLTVDKPHNMYFAMFTNTGGISMLAFLVLILLYFIQSIKLYWKHEYKSFIDYAGIGIFFGVMGFAATGLVDDSSVSVMPMFYGLFGTGVAINIMLQKTKKKETPSSDEDEHI